MQKLILALALSTAFIVGCVLGTTRANDTSPPAFAAQPTAGPMWQHHCGLFQGFDGIKKLNDFANQVGRQGFELVSVTDHGLACFKRRMR